MRTARNRDLASKVRIIQYLAEPTAATLMGYGYALQQNLEEATKKQKQQLFGECVGVKFMLCFLVYLNFFDLGISRLKKEFRLEDLKSDIVRIRI